MRLILPIFAALILTGCDPEDFAPGDRYKADFHYTLKPSDRLSVENFGMGRPVHRDYRRPVCLHSGNAGCDKNRYPRIARHY